MPPQETVSGMVLEDGISEKIRRQDSQKCRFTVFHPLALS
jgi:hypothetical protein